jgi:tetratricopeptide (TPR) repeat protein
MIDQQLGELSAQYEQTPDSVDIVRKIASLYEQRFQNTDSSEDLASAVQWYQYTSDLAKGSDPAVTRKLSDLALKQKDVRIKELSDWFESGGNEHPDAATYQEELDNLKKERADSLISEAKKRVDRNPTDLGLRFELGERLLAAGNYNDAIPELQKARQSPNVRLKAMAFLGRCFVLKGMFDMAATQFETASSEMTAMDATKKETLYDLALLYEKMGQKDKYIKCIKEIAEVDYTYKDVAERIERFYTGDQAA